MLGHLLTINKRLRMRSSALFCVNAQESNAEWCQGSSVSNKQAISGAKSNAVPPAPLLRTIILAKNIPLVLCVHDHHLHTPQQRGKLHSTVPAQAHCILCICNTESFTKCLSRVWLLVSRARSTLRNVLI